MTYLLIILATILLFAGFLSFTAVEGHRGVRLFAGSRDRFDMQVARMLFIIRHVDWSAFLGHLTRQGLERALHDAAHASLLLVRMLERVLTRTVRTLRSRRLSELPAAPMVPAITGTKRGPVSYLKTTLKNARRKPKAAIRVTDVQVREVPAEAE